MNTRHYISLYLTKSAPRIFFKIHIILAIYMHFQIKEKNRNSPFLILRYCLLKKHTSKLLWIKIP